MARQDLPCEQARPVKTVKVQSRVAKPSWIRPSVGLTREGDVPIAIDWVAGRSSPMILKASREGSMYSQAYVRPVEYKLDIWAKLYSQNEHSLW